MSRILVVDDDAESRGALCLLLRDVGHDCVTIASGRDAVASCRHHAVDAVVMDTGLADGCGHAVAAALDQLARPPAVILMSRFGDAAGLTAVDASRVRAHLMKPVRPAALLAALDAALAAQASRR